MLKHDTTPTFASTKQILDLQNLAGRAFLTMSKEQANAILRTDESKKAFQKKMKKLFGFEIELPTDIWEEQKQQISKFYLDCFGITIDWKTVVIPNAPDAFKRLELILENLTEDQIFEAYAKKFGKDKFWKAYDSIRNAIKEQQDRPKGDYALFHRGGLEPDTEHLNKSYDDFFKDGNNYMVPKEGLITAFRHRFETGNMLDVKGITRFYALGSDGGVMDMYRDIIGKFSMDWYGRGSRGTDRGPRQLFL